MGYAEILVQTGVKPADVARMSLAADLAQRFGGGLTGAFVTPPPIVAGFQAGADFGSGAVGSTVAQLLQDQSVEVARDSAQAEEAFRKAASAGGLRSAFLSVSGAGPAALTALARRADLTVLPSASDSPGAGPDAPADHVAMSAGGPVLIVNPEWASGKVGSRILIAWNGSREAGRAVRDAMPFLKTAEKVDVLVVGHEEAASGAEDAVPAYLAKHGCKASVLRVATVDQPIGEVLLRNAARLECDLIVMGLYGHTRLQETVLGGASRDVLRHSRTPLLVSH